MYYMLYYCYYLIKISAASNFIVFNYSFIVCLHAQASELHRSSASKWNSFLSAFPDQTIYQLSYGTKQFFNEIYSASLCLGGALQLIKSLKSVCGLVVATIKRNDWKCLFAQYKLNYCPHQEKRNTGSGNKIAA